MIGENQMPPMQTAAHSGHFAGQIAATPVVDGSLDYLTMSAGEDKLAASTGNTSGHTYPVNSLLRSGAV
jgi:hypothetical protein